MERGPGLNPAPIVANNVYNLYEIVWLTEWMHTYELMHIFKQSCGPNLPIRPTLSQYFSKDLPYKMYPESYKEQ
jgi:hypothetical protein